MVDIITVLNTVLLFQSFLTPAFCLNNSYLLGGHSGIELVSEVTVTGLKLGLGVLHGQLDSLDGLQLFVELFDGGIVLLPLLGQGGLMGAK